MRAIAFDVGRRRTGVAVSDATGTLARPLKVLGEPAIDAAVAVIVALRDEPDGLGAVVVGWPRRLDGSDSSETPHVRAFADALEAATGLPVTLQDERLTSVEAEQRLAEREPDWRARKAKLDAAAAAIILQDYLDARARERALLGLIAEDEDSRAGTA
jgi:putative Holliday junction resolvase